MASQQRLEFLAFLDITDIQALAAYARRVIARSDHLTDLIWASDVVAIPIGYIAVHRHYHPPHLHLTPESLKALSSNGVGPLSKDAKTTVNKVMATLKNVGCSTGTSSGSGNTPRMASDLFRPA